MYIELPHFVVIMIFLSKMLSEIASTTPIPLLPTIWLSNFWFVAVFEAFFVNLSNLLHPSPSTAVSQVPKEQELLFWQASPFLDHWNQQKYQQSLFKC